MSPLRSGHDPGGAPSSSAATTSGSATRDAGAGTSDARTYFFYVATVNTPAMAWKLVGKGSKYAGADTDVHGNFIDGAKSYRLRLPPDVPIENFWSVCVYDTQTRSELQTSQPYPSRNSVRGELEYNSDGSVDILFGPEPPESLQNNWIQTVPGKAWFTILRLYAPLEPWYDHTWKPGDIEPITD